MDGLPPGLQPPISLAMAKAVPRIPSVTALPGGSVYEPKWDGYRAAIVSAAGSTTIWSRQGKDLTRYFPDLIHAAEKHIPPGCVVDGEAVIWTRGRLDFEALQRRMTSSKSSLAFLVHEHPASFAAFDVLAVAGHDVRALPHRGRRALLEELTSGWTPPLNLSPMTTDRDEAEHWFESMPATGIEGLVIKGSSQAYEGGQRIWLKAKRRDNLDVVCAAVIGRRDRPSQVVAGLPVNGRLQIVGRSSQLTAAASKALAAHLHIPRSGHPWPEEISPGALDRFSKEKGPVHLTLVEPLVIEVAADTAWSGRSFRHPLRYLRARPELNPEEVSLPEHLGRD